MQNGDETGVDCGGSCRFSLVDVSGTIATDVKFYGASTAGNGQVVFAPREADGVGTFLPERAAPTGSGAMTVSEEEFEKILGKFEGDRYFTRGPYGKKG